MHTFYKTDAQEHCKNAWFWLLRGPVPNTVKPLAEACRNPKIWPGRAGAREVSEINDLVASGPTLAEARRNPEIWPGRAGAREVSEINDLVASGQGRGDPPKTRNLAQEAPEGREAQETPFERGNGN